jgi:hypothetical protein
VGIFKSDIATIDQAKSFEDLFQRSILHADFHSGLESLMAVFFRQIKIGQIQMRPPVSSFSYGIGGGQ